MLKRSGQVLRHDELLPSGFISDYNLRELFERIRYLNQQYDRTPEDRARYVRVLVAADGSVAQRGSIELAGTPGGEEDRHPMMARAAQDATPAPIDAYFFPFSDDGSGEWLIPDTGADVGADRRRRRDRLALGRPMRAREVTLLGSCLAALLGCARGGATSHADAEPPCVPFEARACPCLGGGTGTQTCSRSGRAFGACRGCIADAADGGATLATLDDGSAFDSGHAAPGHGVRRGLACSMRARSARSAARAVCPSSPHRRGRPLHMRLRGVRRGRGALRWTRGLRARRSLLRNARVRGRRWRALHGIFLRSAVHGTAEPCVPRARSGLSFRAALRR